MPRSAFEAEVEKLNEIERQEIVKLATAAPKAEHQKEKSAIIDNRDLATYSIGEKVKHGRFGIGEILADDGKIVEVKFNEGKKSLLKQFAKLEKI